MWINDLIKWFIIISFLLILYLIRKRFIKPFNWIKENVKSAKGFYKKNESTISTVANSYVTTIVLFLLFIIFSTISFFLAVIFFSTLLVSIINLIVNFVKKRNTVSINLKDKIENDIDDTDDIINN